jgi:phospholipid/cholesterol/gamma-HCH transport system permease protein
MDAAQPRNPARRPASLPAAFLDSLGAQALRFAGAAGHAVAGKAARVGEVALLTGRIALRAPLFFRNPSLTFQQLIRIGISSLPLIIVISVFIGAVTAIQADYQFRGFVPATYLGTAVCKFVIIESGPVLTALVLAGRVGSAIAAEIGTMKEKEELDAMTVLDLDPLRYLALPRLLSGLLAFPLLTIISDFLAIIGGWMVTSLILNVTTATYVHGLRFLFSGYDIWVGLVKSMVFGGIVVLMGYYHGTGAGAGAKGVGQASMRSVVSSSVLILVMDFVIVYIAY